MNQSTKKIFRHFGPTLVSCTALLTLLQFSCISVLADDKPLDVAIRGGRVVDGTGAPWYVADVGIKDGKIVRIGRIDEHEAQTVLDATGLVVAPGFIDMMGQTASPMIDDAKTAINLLTQGITTINAGEGSSAAPLSAAQERRQGWTTMAEYFALLESRGLPVNVVQTVGHTQVRRLVLGDIEKRPSAAELQQMQELVREAMRAGAIGVSTALIYPPAVYAETEEIAALAAAAGEYGGRYYTHMRNEGDRLLEAIEEALEIGQQGNTPVHIYHLKAAGRQNWGKMRLAIARIQQARTAGQQVTADIYPYVNNGLGIAALIHPRHFSEGYDKLKGRLNDAELRATIRKEMETTDGWENWFRHAGHDWQRIIVGRTDDPLYAGMNGKSVAEIARSKSEDVWDTFFQLVRSGAFVLPETMTHANKILAMQQNFVSFCTDVGPSGSDRIASHPRAFGSFPRLLAYYVRDFGAISLERAVAQASAAAANKVLAYDRGRIAVGLAADIIVFDYNQLTDHATFEKPDAVSSGMRHVLVNGRVVLHDGQQTDARPGRVLRGPGFDQKTAAWNIATGDADPKFAAFDQRLKAFMQEHRVPGVAVAMTQKGKLVFAKGYGYADIARQEPVQPTSLFRIASISKPVTAVAILQLVEQGKLQLEDKVFQILDHTADIAAAGEKFDPRCHEITIEHLLQHRGGWDRDQSFDAMFQSVRFARENGMAPPANPATVIKAMCAEKLDFDPGERYAYSNYGYCLLGRVIEKISGQSYTDYVRSNVLAPLDISTMQTGATRLEGRTKGEVRYYHPGKGKSVFAEDLDQDVPTPYGAWNLEAMDSHGGWIASAVDLAKFAAAFDDPDHCPILNRDTIQKMHERPPGAAGLEKDGSEKATYYSLGWMNRVVKNDKLNHWHTGSLNGTATILIRRHDGINLVALLNSRVSPSASHLGRAIDSLLHQAADEVLKP